MNRFRIALIDSSLQQLLTSLRPSLQIERVDPSVLDSLVGKVDLFLLDDETAIRFLGSRSEETWPSVVVTARDGDRVPAAFQQGIVDDLLVLPPRALDLERIIRGHEMMQALHSLEESSHGIEELVRRLKEDINLAQKIQRRLIREKFSPLGPLSVKSKYWCGLKSGGDYFDFFEFPQGNQAGIILSDCSSYALSTNFISALVHGTVTYGKDLEENPATIMQSLMGKIRDEMKDNERLSFFYGIFDRKTCRIRYIAVGQIYLAKFDREGKVSWIYRADQEALSAKNNADFNSQEVSLQPGERILLCSDGWGSSLETEVTHLFEELLISQADSQGILDELAFRLRRKLEEESDDPATVDGDFPMPPEDCSVMLFDLALNTLRRI